MKYLPIIFFMIGFSSSGQSLEGTYLGSLVGDQDIILIEKDKKHYLVTLHTGESTSIISVGTEKFGGLVFEIPMNDGDELVVFAKRKGDMLALEFELEMKKHQVNFSPLIKSSASVTPSSSKEQIDERLVGTWIEKQSFNYDGSLNKELDNSAKNYKVVYTEDGRYILDTRFFRDLARKGGHDFQFSDIPSYYFSTSEEKYLILKVPAINAVEKISYEIRGDSLIIFDKITKTVLIKEK
ncbi:hypothetical protein A33Q_0696 [Indibacter alkaliphilus LW1]|uniref:Uncharacterized protein n=1 Tax=Indibacter alkaliphilus (strain CCUG 57479 / KCTC 22604 / LW1) TaxID=1189612 RepID=S2EAG5_INDAL|nr:hypothetical protein [Indibacter alkaliphilus]EOZ99318.1 hypothetical protein A33Q_0696 [Indibacter alkaliphilus LW1]